MPGRRRSRWQGIARAVAQHRPSVSFGSMLVSWSGSSIFHLAGTRRLRTLRYRRSGRCAADSLSPSSGVACGGADIRMTFDSTVATLPLQTSDESLKRSGPENPEMPADGHLPASGWPVTAGPGRPNDRTAAAGTITAERAASARCAGAANLPEPNSDSAATSRARSARFADRRFFWFPPAELDEAYNNIFATSNQTTCDWITVLQPTFDLLSSFPRNALNLDAGASSRTARSVDTGLRYSGRVKTGCRAAGSRCFVYTRRPTALSCASASRNSRPGTGCG